MLLPRVLEPDTAKKALANAILVGFLVLVIGCALAVAHNRLRRMCSLVYEQNNKNPSKGRLFGITLWSTTVCCLRETFMIFLFYYVAFLVGVLWWSKECFPFRARLRMGIPSKQRS